MLTKKFDGNEIACCLYDVETNEELMLPIIMWKFTSRKVHIIPFNGQIHMIDVDETGLTGHRIVGRTPPDDTSDRLRCSECYLMSQCKIDGTLLHTLVMTIDGYIKITINGESYTQTHIPFKHDSVLHSKCPFDEYRQMFCKFKTLVRNNRFRILIEWLNDNCDVVDSTVLKGVDSTEIAHYLFVDGIIHVTTTSCEVVTCDLRTGDVLCRFTDEDLWNASTYINIAYITEDVYMLRASPHDDHVVQKYVHYPSGTRYDCSREPALQ